MSIPALDLSLVPSRQSTPRGDPQSIVSSARSSPSVPPSCPAVGSVRRSLQVVRRSVVLGARAGESEALQKALKESQDTIREEARRAGAAEALLLERAAAGESISQAALDKRAACRSSRSSNGSYLESTFSTTDAVSDLSSTRTTCTSESEWSDPRCKHSAAADLESHDFSELSDSLDSRQKEMTSSMRSRLDQNTRQLLELQEELQIATSDRDELSFALATSAQVRAEQQVELSQLSSQYRALQKELEEQREHAVQLLVERQELEARYHSRCDQCVGDDEPLSFANPKPDASLHPSANASAMAALEGPSDIMTLKFENQSLLRRLASAELQRIKMHNELQELKGSIRVICRVRPASENSPLALEVQQKNRIMLCHDADSYAFEFDRVLGADSSQADVFAEVEGLVQSALDGYKVCIYAYGQTGSGKTHTMQGPSDFPSCGLIPRTLNKLFRTADEMRSQGWTWSFKVSFMEVYNENLRDLLPGSGESTFASPEHVIVKSEDWGTMVKGMRCIDVTSVEQTSALLAGAMQQRSVGATDMNSCSSRSHSIFAMYLTGTNEKLGIELRGALHLVDLAGSERLDKSGATGERLKETQHINKSLASLAHVFAAKAEGCTHVPFRSSKLTHLMQPCLSGQGKTLMVVNVRSEEADSHETLCSLRFASQVAQCNTGGKPLRGVKQLSMSSRSKSVRRCQQDIGESMATPRGRRSTTPGRSQASRESVLRGAARPVSPRSCGQFAPPQSMRSSSARMAWADAPPAPEAVFQQSSSAAAFPGAPRLRTDARADRKLWK